jgi:hypothetical protein
MPLRRAGRDHAEIALPSDGEMGGANLPIRAVACKP